MGGKGRGGRAGEGGRKGEGKEEGKGKESEGIGEGREGRRMGIAHPLFSA